MPVRNCAATIALAVRSIVAQTCEEWELLVIDDGSSEETARTAASFHDQRIRVIADGSGNLGLAARLNQGIALAEGKYFARMDGDDVSFPRRLEREVEYLERHPGVDLVGCGMVIFRDKGRMVGVQRARRSHAEICGNSLRSCLLPHATWMGRAAWFQKHKYRAGLHRAEDRELLLRSRDVSCFAGLPEILYGYRVDRVSLVKNARARLEYLAAVTGDARARGDWTRYFTAGAAEIAKLSIDSIALATHTERWVLRHRAAPAEGQEVAEKWSAIWQSLSARQEEVLACASSM